MVTGCTTARQPATRATVEDRTAPPAPKRVVTAPQPVSQTVAMEATQHIVTKGDTLYSISRQYQVDWHAIQSANNMADPNQLVIGQRLIIPGKRTSTAMVTPGVVTAPLSSSASGSGANESVKATTSSADTGTPVAAGAWRWPVDGGQIAARFGENGNKGLDIAASEGTPVFASAAGKVIFSSNNIRGYGNLIVIRHDNDFLTAYGYNRRLLVKEGDVVKQGDKIAEVGSSGTDSSKLHFEIRNAKSKPEDPLKYLPKR